MRQGSVYAGVPITWIPENMHILRPHAANDWLSVRGYHWRDVPDRFRVGDGVERVVVHAKSRPVVVVSSEADLRPSQPVRVVPLYSYRPGSFAHREHAAIEAGRISHLLHVRSRGDVREGYLNLRAATAVPVDFFADATHVGDLDRPSLGTLLRRYATYVAA
jgi:hypothetical protein